MMRSALPFALVLLATVPASGQTTGFGSGGANPVVPAAKSGPARPVPPPALPGSRAEPSAIAPPIKLPSEMPPTEALFDAINRGDLPVAKDAISRGADLRGRNVLGLTPLELSVDLGRNEISFLLLSLRGNDGGAVATAEPAPPPGRAGRPAAARAERGRTAARVADAAPAAPQTARLFANDGGAPVPQAGFLGFDPPR